VNTLHNGDDDDDSSSLKIIQKIPEQLTWKALH
jgi:hypothetical protein